MSIMDNSSFFNKIEQITKSNVVQLINTDFTTTEIACTKMEPSDSFYKKILKKIGYVHSLSILTIERMDNPFTKTLYRLKKLQMEETPERKVNENMLFHGTKLEYVDSIHKYNYNYRYAGGACGAKFGRGVYFTKHFDIANHYANYSTMKIVTVNNVLIGKIKTVESRIDLPDDGIDTTTNPFKDALVKYHDDVMYPECRILYRL